ncbi:MAG: class F sortase, partial [Chloroflexia bacterium]|nr:class F sortase [Chloroflexia bacterium]
PEPTATPQPTPPPLVASAGASTTRPGRLVIPAIGLDRELFPVGLDRNRVPIVLDHELAWYQSSATPGQGENIVLWGHVLRFRATPHIPAPFARLQELSIGSRLTLYGRDGSSYDYTVTRQVWARPEEVQYMLPQGRELVTMISCIGEKVIVDGSVEMTHRLITIAEPVR